jgi:KUP system potassium uptake protein
LHFLVEDVPRVPNIEKIKTEKLGSGFHRIIARYEFMEEFKLGTVLTLDREKGLDLALESTTFYIGRENLVHGDTPDMSRWRANLLIFMSRNAAGIASLFNLPADQVIEVGFQLEI